MCVKSLSTMLLGNALRLLPLFFHLALFFHVSSDVGPDCQIFVPGKGQGVGILKIQLHMFYILSFAWPPNLLQSS